MSAWPSIPGETPIDVSGLRIKIVTNRAMLHRAEARNILNATQKYLSPARLPRTATFELHWAKKLHKEMFGAVWSWAGQIRTTDLNIGVPAPHIESALHSLMQDLIFWQNSRTPLLEQAAMLHHRAVLIHPFLNGNGRWARFLANIWLKRHNHPVTEWPEQTLGDESVIRKEYLIAIRAADNADFQPLLNLVSQYTPQPPSEKQK